MKLWIIYKERIGFSRFIAEILQDHLKDCIDVSVGNAKQIDPAFLVEGELEYLIIGDVISKTAPSLEIQNWLQKYREISKGDNLIVKAVSGFYVTLTDFGVEPFWSEFLQDNVKAKIVYPPVLRLNLNKVELKIEDETLELIKNYSNHFIEFLINNKKNN
ncbi:MAG: hypothetical protein ACFFCV_00805 [Promethearchaeota archaeon]